MLAKLTNLFANIQRAIARARWSIVAIAATYALSLAVGMIMVHTGNTFAINYRDQLITKAHTSDSSMQALDTGHPLQAALLDFGGNLIGAISNTLTGLGVVFPFPFVAYRGWVGGIVSIDGNHVSRLASAYSAFYYLLTLTLQLIPYSLAGGIGINLGLTLYRVPPHYIGPKWLGFPQEALRDLARVYVIIIPLFLIASLWEFLAP